MRRYLRLLALALVMVATTVAPAGAITHGEPDTGGAYSWVGSIVVGPFDFGAGPEYFQWCSGSWTSLNEEPFFLTAGHCIFFLDVFGIPLENRFVTFQQDLDTDDDFIVSAGEVEESLVPFTSAAWHPGFKTQAASASNIYDVAIVELAESDNLPDSMGAIAPVGFMDPVKGKPRVTAVGYGASEWMRPGLLPTNERRIADTQVQTVLKSQVLLNQTYSNGRSENARKNEGSCFGDSGGPGLYEGYIFGVESWGDAICVATGFKYRVDTREVQDWIADQL